MDRYKPYDKNSIDIDCEREALCLRKQNRCTNHNINRVRVEHDYNVDKFNRLFIEVK